jgi:Putative Actinobacterial Holin-X, holin superfamily III
MVRPHSGDETDGIISLVKETADGLGHLIADHIKLARVEIVSDAKTYSRQVGLLALAGAFAVFGYLFVWIAAALALGRVIGGAAAFLIVGLLHVIGGVLGLMAVMRRLKRARGVLDGTATEVGRSVSTLAAGVTGRTDPDRVPTAR